MTMSLQPVAGARSRRESVAILALLLLTAMAAAGYAIFAIHPERLAVVPGAAVAYVHAMRLFPPAHIAAGAVALGAVLTWRTGAAWVPSAVVLYLVSLASEMLGTNVGLPFGPYRYTDGLGVKWFDHVPVLIPLSWFVMALPSFALATRWVSTHRAWRIVVAAGLLVSWDLALDPAMSRLMPYWIWASDGPYYGMPLLNLAGWFVTGLALMSALAMLRVDRWLDSVPTMPLAGVYAANLALPVAMAAAAGLWPAAMLATLPFGVAACLAASRSWRSR